MKVLASAIRLGDSIEYGLEVLKEMKYSLVWNRSLVPVQALLALRRTLKVLKAQGEDIHETIPIMTDERIKRVCDILSQLNETSYRNQNLFLMIFCACEIVSLTLQHGLCNHSCSCVATVGFLSVMVFQDYQTGSGLGEMALAMHKRAGKADKAKTIFVANEFCFAWTKPIHLCRDFYYEGYLSGLQTGDCEFSMWCLHSYFDSLTFILGRPLEEILDRCQKISMQIKDSGQQEQFLCAKCYWQMFLNLRSPEGIDPWVFGGQVFNAADWKATDSNVVSALVHYAECQLLLFYDPTGDGNLGASSLAERAISQRKKYDKLNPGAVECTLETFHRGVALYVAARRTRKWRYRRHADLVRKKLLKWQSAGNPNLVYYLLFLDAEKAALARKFDQAEEKYKKAIAFVSKSGYLHHAALFNELYADFLLHERKDLVEAEYRWKESIRYYEDWGALGKVEMLKKKLLESN